MIDYKNRNDSPIILKYLANIAEIVEISKTL